MAETCTLSCVAASAGDRVWRAIRTQRLVQAQLKRANISALKIQAMIRSRQERNRTQLFIARMRQVATDRLALKQTRAALRVQAAWHKKKGRMSMFLKHQARKDEQQRQNANAITIQRFVRHRTVRHATCKRMAVCMADILIQVARRHKAASIIQRKIRSIQAFRVGKVILAQYKMKKKREARRHERQKVIDVYLKEAQAKRIEEHNERARIQMNHVKVEAERERLAIQAAEAKRKRIEDMKAMPRPPPREYRPKKRK